MSSPGNGKIRTLFFPSASKRLWVSQSFSTSISQRTSQEAWRCQNPLTALRWWRHCASQSPFIRSKTQLSEKQCCCLHLYRASSRIWNCAWLTESTLIRLSYKACVQCRWKIVMFNILNGRMCVGMMTFLCLICIGNWFFHHSAVVYGLPNGFQEKQYFEKGRLLCVAQLLNYMSTVNPLENIHDYASWCVFLVQMTVQLLSLLTR